MARAGLSRRDHLAASERLLAERLSRLEGAGHRGLVADARAVLAEVAELRRAGPRERLTVHWLCASEQAAARLQRLAREVALADFSRTPFARQGKPRVVVLSAVEALAARLEALAASGELARLAATRPPHRAEPWVGAVDVERHLAHLLAELRRHAARQMVPLSERCPEWRAQAAHAADLVAALGEWAGLE